MFDEMSGSIYGRYPSFFDTVVHGYHALTPGTIIMLNVVLNVRL
jgi:hypothetical protein